MALLPCPECGKQVSAASAHCIHCGHPTPVANGASAPTQPATRQSQPILIVIATLAAAAVGLLLQKPWQDPFERRAEKVTNAYAAAMQSDLANLMIVQEAYFADHRRYASNISDLAFQSTEFVEVAIYDATDKGFRAKATRMGITGECYVWSGPESEFRVVSREAGKPACTGSLR